MSGQFRPCLKYQNSILGQLLPHNAIEYAGFRMIYNGGTFSAMSDKLNGEWFAVSLDRPSWAEIQGAVAQAGNGGETLFQRQFGEIGIGVENANSYLKNTAGTGATNQGQRGGVSRTSNPFNSGGGGGAKVRGQDGVESNNTFNFGKSADGGAGESSNITGTAVTRAGGGGGGASGTSSNGFGGAGGGGNGGPQNQAAQNGTVNTGGGAGGGSEPSSLNGGSGGSGIVIVRYLTA
jgi:hypothetical protein